MIITNSQNNLISDNLLFMIKECDPINSEGITCASIDQIKNKTNLSGSRLKKNRPSCSKAICFFGNWLKFIRKVCFSLALVV